MATRLVIDTDPAIGYAGRDVDDGLAILALLADPEVEVLGLTVTFGNVPLAKGVAKAREILRRAGRADIPVLAGADSARALYRETEAAEFLRRAARENPGLAVLGIGPATNLATAALDPAFLPGLGALVLLGGVRSPPSRLWQRAGFEFNFRQDVPAARALVSRAKALTLFPMEVCRELTIGPRALLRLGASGGAAAWAASRSLPWLMLSPLLWAAPGFHPWDVLPALAVSRPGLFRYERGRYRVGLMGELAPDDEPGPAARLAVAVDRDAFFDELFRRFSRYRRQPC